MEVSIAPSKVPSRKPKALKKKNLRLRAKKHHSETIMIDQKEGLVFSSEKELFEHFQIQIDFLEAEHDALAKKYLSTDPKINQAEAEREAKIDIEDQLDFTLDLPTEIWHDSKTFPKFSIFHFIRGLDEVDLFHVAVAYVSHEDEPTFVFLHFITGRVEMVENYRRGDLVYDHNFEEVGFAMLEGDALSEGDPLGMGLFIAMLKIRGEKDIPYSDFQNLGEELRESTIETADEIWRSVDSSGNRIVTFIKEFSDHEKFKDLYYLAVTQEDAATKVHTLLFSFPTDDDTLVDRYRHGENLQADEVIQESSH